MPQPWIEALTAPDEADFLEYARAQGPGYLLHVEARLGLKYDTTSLASFEPSREVLDEPLMRVRRLLAQEHGFTAKLERYEEFRALSPEDALRQVRRVERAYAIDAERDREPLDRIEGIQEILLELEELNSPIPSSHLYFVVAENYGRLGDREAQGKWLNKTLDQGDRFGSYRMSCQALGVLSSLAGQAGELEAMLAHLERGFELAKRYHIPGQAGRLASFLGYYYESVGRLSLARDLRREAQDLCTRLGGDPSEVRYYISWLKFQARMGCWEIVERDLEHAELRLAKLEGWSTASAIRLNTLQIEELRARVDMTWGRVDSANRRFISIESRYTEEDGPWMRRMRLAWSRGLLYNDKPFFARELLWGALENESNDAMRMILHLEVARAEAALGRWVAAFADLDSFERRAAQSKDLLLDAWTMHDALRIRAKRGIVGSIDRPNPSSQLRPRAVAEAVESACRNLSSRLRAMDASQEGYFALRNTQPLREELHAIVDEDPAAGYALELAWRQNARLLGATAEDLVLPVDPLVRCAQIAALSLRGGALPTEFVDWAAPDTDDATHILYRVKRDGTDRWVRQNGRIEHELLPLGEIELSERIGAVLRELGSPPESASAELASELQRELHSLAEGLLPAEPSKQLWLSPDGPLEALPFGLLNLSRDGYEPLIAEFDPVYLGGSGGPCIELPREAPGLIVAEPELTGSGLSQGLPRLELALAEAEALQAWSPQSLYLEGARATKRAVVENWESASFLYFASHMVRDPEAPYLSYLPLGAEADETQRDAAYLDVSDLKRVRFPLCPLVVLSACNSGTPYVAHGAQAPGLGDAFLDAGASAVIQTYWAVDDAATAQLMRKTMRAWAKDGLSPEMALNHARREMATEPGPFRHPFYWAGALAKVRVH